MRIFSGSCGMMEKRFKDTQGTQHQTSRYRVRRRRHCAIQPTTEVASVGVSSNFRARDGRRCFVQMHGPQTARKSCMKNSTSSSRRMFCPRRIHMIFSKLPHRHAPEVEDIDPKLHPDQYVCARRFAILYHEHISFFRPSDAGTRDACGAY